MITNIYAKTFCSDGSKYKVQGWVHFSSHLFIIEKTNGKSLYTAMISIWSFLSFTLINFDQNYCKINAETSDWNPRVMCTSKSIAYEDHRVPPLYSYPVRVFTIRLSFSLPMWSKSPWNRRANRDLLARLIVRCYRDTIDKTARIRDYFPKTLRLLDNHWVITKETPTIR